MNELDKEMMNPDEEARDLIEGTDEDGNKVQLEVIRYFFYNGEEYVVLGDAGEDGCSCGCECCEHECGEEDEDCEPVNLYIMKVVETEEDGETFETFEAVEDQDLLDKLIEVVEADFSAEESLDEE